jgi:PAS domain S-box-containing protein
MQSKILYVDDEEQNLIGFKAAFRKNYEIQIASNTSIATEILQNNEIKVLITDQRMPSETGLEFLKRIIPLYPNLICIILTAYSDVQNILMAINQGGIFRYLLKPWDKSEMQLAIDSAIQTYDLKKENEQLIKELQYKNLALQKSEEKFKNIFNTSVDSIFITDFTGNFLDVNQITIDKTGISKEKFLTLSIFDLAEENIDQLKAGLDNRNTETFVETSSSYMNPITEKRVYFETRSRIIDYNDEKAVLHITHDITERLSQEKTILKTIIETEEKERSRVARELHDGVSPVLAATRLYAQSFTFRKDKELEPIILQRLEDTINEAIQSITEISNNLSPHILQNFGLYNAIENFIEKLKDTQKINFIFNINKQDRLSENIETTIYRITVELINNTIKYAQATEIVIDIHIDETIQFMYSDNGKGFDYNEYLKQKKGMGFYNIISRMKTLNGSVSIKSEIGSGMCVNITIPRDPQ